MQRALVIVLALLLFGCSLLVVTAQHHARGLFIDLERALARGRQLEADGNRLRVELGRAAQPAAVETAARRLGLQPIDSARTVFLPASVVPPAGTTEVKEGR